MTWLARWKEILGSIAAVLVVLLQIINVFLGQANLTHVTSLETTIDQQVTYIQQRTDALLRSMQQNGQISQGNRDILQALHDEIHKLEEEMAKK